MADRTPSRPPTPRPQPSSNPTGKRETAEERRVRQTAAAIATQVDLKREAAERRNRKSEGS